MMKRVGATLILTLLAVQANAVMLSRGVRELAISGYVNRDTDFNLAVTAKGGRFIQDFMQVGPMGSLAWLQGGDIVRLGGGMFGEINVPLHDHPLLYPYYGATTSALYSDIDSRFGGSSRFAVEVSGYGGMKYFLQDNLAVGADLEIKLATSKIYFGDNKLQNFDWIINLSTRFYF